MMAGTKKHDRQQLREGSTSSASEFHPALAGLAAEAVDAAAEAEGLAFSAS